MILSAQTIRRAKLIADIQGRTVSHGLTFGLGPAGYDIRIAEDLILWPGRFVLASAMEYFQMPKDVLGVVHDKSTWARRGVALQNTVIEPGWCGFLTLEITMHRFKFIRLRAGMPIAQVVFHLLDEITENPYQGKYQNQAAGPQPAIAQRS